MSKKNYSFEIDENEMFRVEYYEDWEPGKMFQFHYEPAKGWRPASNPHVIVLGDVKYKDLKPYLDKQRQILWSDIYAEIERRKQSGRWLKLRFLVLKRDNYHCTLCGRGAEDGVTLEAGHITARAKGGRDEMDNLKTMCFDCNRGMGVEEP